MEEIIKQKCETAGVDVEKLTQEELAQLRREIEKERNGMTVLDGVLSNIEIKLR